MKTYFEEKDSDQRQTIVDQVDLNMFVEAGAGAGKTTLIVERVQKQLLEKGYRPDELVVITFTNAAAEELRARILKKLMEADPQYRQKAEEVLRNIDKMQISTIHSFCNVLLREQCFAAGLPVDFEILEEDEAEARRDAAFDEWIKTLHVTDWDELRGTGDEYYQIRYGIHSIYRNLCTCAENVTKDCLDYGSADGTETELKEAVCEFLQTIWELVQLYVDEAAEWECACNQLEEYLEEFFDPDYEIYAFGDEEEEDAPGLTLDDLQLTDLLGLVEGVRSLKPDMRKKENREHSKEFVSGFQAANEALEAKQKEVNEKNSKYRVYIPYAIQAWEYFRKNRAKDELSNDQLLFQTQQLLDDQNVRKYFADKYRCIYVDEFQDTDRIQADFIWKLAQKKDDPGRLRDGALFLVGDPKQSIYRFRGAEPEVYFEIKEKMENLQNAEVFLLSMNYRSNDRVVTWVNDEFSRRTLTEKGSYPNMEPGHRIPEDQAVSGSNTKLLAGMYKIEEPEKPEPMMTVEQDAEAVSNLITNLVKGGYQIWDKKEGAPREIRYQDFLVLTHTTGNFAVYMKAFSEAEIPVQLYGKITVDGEEALSSFLRMYRALVCRKDRFAQIGAIESLRKNQTKVPDGENPDDFYRRLLKGLSEETKRLDAYGIADYLVNHPEWLLKKNVSYEPAKVRSVQIRLQQMLETVLAQNHSDGNTLADAFEAYLGNVIEKEFSMKREDNAIRLMNIHKAKGLEGAIVIWAKRDKRVAFSEDSYQEWNQKEQKPVRYLSVSGGLYNQVLWCSYKWDEDIYRRAAKAEENELCRLEYVAATRAEQAMIFMEPLKGDGMMFFHGMPNQYLFNNPLLPRHLIQKKTQGGAQTAGSIRMDAGEIQKKRSQLCAKREALSVPVYESQSPSSLEKQSRTRLKALEEKKAEKPEEHLDLHQDRPVGNVVGTMLHRVMELMVNRYDWKNGLPQDPKSIISVCVRQAIFENCSDLPEKITPESCRMFLETAACSLWGYFKDSHWMEEAEIYTEYPFSYSSKGENGEVWVNGIADLLLVKGSKEDRSVTILDYKSDAAEYLEDEEQMKDSLREKYEEQLRYYRDAVQKIFGITDPARICGKIIYFRHYDSAGAFVETKVFDLF